MKVYRYRDETRVLSWSKYIIQEMEVQRLGDKNMRFWTSNCVADGSELTFVDFV